MDNSDQLVCPKCYQSYNEFDKKPMILCLNMHNMCQNCLNNSYYNTCPKCNLAFNKSEVVPNQFLINKIKTSNGQTFPQNNQEINHQPAQNGNYYIRTDRFGQEQIVYQRPLPNYNPQLMQPYAQEAMQNQKQACGLICLMVFLFIGFSALFVISLGEYGQFTTLSYISLIGIILSFLGFGAVGFMNVRRQQRLRQNFYNQLRT